MTQDTARAELQLCIAVEDGAAEALEAFDRLEAELVQKWSISGDGPPPTPRSAERRDLAATLSEARQRTRDALSALVQIEVSQGHSEEVSRSRAPLGA
jgi:hypothetical protein